jgi:alkanesulfonate monooxygenase SsuD/methylene tetrahydromethanopterin reductase-like flavin-dependent oxidoreductase (luciferase family)
MIPRLDAACAAIGRDPATIVRSAMTGVLIGDSEPEVAKRIEAQLTMFGMGRAEGAEWLSSRRGRWVIGTPDRPDRYRGVRGPGSSGSSCRRSCPATWR